MKKILSKFSSRIYIHEGSCNLCSGMLLFIEVPNTFLNHVIWKMIMHNNNNNFKSSKYTYSSIEHGLKPKLVTQNRDK